VKHYQKILTLFERDKNRKVIVGKWSHSMFDYLKDNIWTADEKINGTNIRVKWTNGKIRFGGKEDNADISTELLDFLMDKFEDKKIMESIFGSKEACIYGEGVGPRITKGSELYTLGSENKFQFIVFDVWVDGWWLDKDMVTDVAINLNLERVLNFGEMNLMTAVEKVQRDLRSHLGDFPIEGFVLRPLVPLFNKKGERVIGKIKAKDF